MSTRRAIGQFLRKVGLYSITVRFLRLFWRAVGVFTFREGRTLSGYLASTAAPKLHVGCGDNYLAGWLNTDLTPNSRRVRLDATRRFPYPDNTFDFIFSEHMIEHIPYEQGQIMITECFRVLKPGGTIRIVTPDIRFLMGLYQNPENPLNRQYIQWNGGLFLKGDVPRTAVSVVNNYFRDWGHQYIYDEETMKGLMSKIGFTDVIREKIHQSRKSELQRLEHAVRMPEGFLELESMVIEGVKPPRG